MLQNNRKLCKINGERVAFAMGISKEYQQVSVYELLGVMQHKRPHVHPLASSSAV